MRSRVLGFIFLMSISGTANAVPVTYDETISGDLLGLPLHINQPPFTTLTFNLGVNKIRGTAALYSVDDSPLNDQDPFTFVIPVGLHVDGYSISWQVSHLNPITNFLIASWLILEEQCSPSCSSVSGHLAIDLVHGDGTSSLNMPPIMLLGPGTYTAIHGVGTDLAGAGSFDLVTYSYELSLNVFAGDVPPPPPIPEPNTLALFGVGVVALGALRRRSRTVVLRFSCISPA